MKVLRYIAVFVCLAGGAFAQSEGKRPVIVIPGIMGSKLVDASGKTVWFSPKRNKVDDLRLPMTSPVLARNRDSVRVEDIIREVDLPILPDIEVYKSVIDALKGRGYTEAAWSDPRATDVFYIYPYDWRRDNVESAHALVRKMVEVKRKLNRPDLKFDIICHSMGGLIARYAAMYGLADLKPGNAAPVPNWSGAAHIEKFLMFGTPNQGSFGSFEALLNGYGLWAGKRVPFFDNLRNDEVLAIPSSFQLMPHQNSARFFDENLRPIKVDIYDPKTWDKYRWGALHDPKFLSKLKDAAQLAKRNPAIKPEKVDDDAGADDRLIARTTYAQARAYFLSALDRAKRFHRALNVPVAKLPFEMHAYGGNCDETLDGAVLVYDEKKKRWDTIFDPRDIKTSSGSEIKKEAVKAALIVMGDNRVTPASLLAATPTLVNGKTEFINPAFPVQSSMFTCTSHNKLFLDKPIQDSFLSALIVKAGVQP
jgi:pimeloyl-ACP methyl ester carboxylesterase